VLYFFNVFDVITRTTNVDTSTQLQSRTVGQLSFIFTLYSYTQYSYEPKVHRKSTAVLDNVFKPVLSLFTF